MVGPELRREPQAKAPERCLQHPPRSLIQTFAQAPPKIAAKCYNANIYGILGRLVSPAANAPVRNGRRSCRLGFRGLQEVV